MAQRNLKSITFEGLPIKYLIPTTGVVDLGEDPNFYDSLDTLVEEGTYKVSDGDFAYIIKIERPSENTVGQTYWSTEEGMTALYTRTGWFDGESWSFNEWDAPLYSGNAYSIFSDKQHVHYLMKTTDNFEEWIDNYTPGNFRVLDSTTEKYYYVSAEGYSVALNGRLRRYQSYFEVTEPWKVYSRAGTATVGNSGYITWDAWHCVDDSLPTPEDIGAAPAGYGLGLTGSHLTTLSNADDAQCNGWYHIDANTTNGVGHNAILRVDCEAWAHCIQTAYGASYSSSTPLIMRRVKNNGVWGEWEWENPPMVLGVEYRTTERYNNKPVYTKLLNFGTPLSGFGVNFSNETVTAIRHTGRLGNNSLPYADVIADTWFAYVHITGNTIFLFCNSNWETSEYPWYHQIWYIKE